MMKNIRKVIVEDDQGRRQTYVGEAGYAQVTTISKKGQPYQRQVSVSLTLPAQPDVKE